MINIEVKNSVFPLINSLNSRTTVQHLRRFGLFGILNCFNARVERLTATPPFRWCRQSASSRLPGSAAGCKLHGIHAGPACLPHSVALQGSINFLARPALMKCRRWDCHPCLPPTACCLPLAACWCLFNMQRVASPSATSNCSNLELKLDWLGCISSLIGAVHKFCSLLGQNKQTSQVGEEWRGGGWWCMWQGA